jgi:predicted ATPase/DNA-binding SARP family transcriptional activator
MHLDVLGPLVLRRGDTDVTPSSAIARRLLCLLAARAPATVSTDELVDVAWPDGALPKEPQQNLHTYVARIRRLGGARPGEPGLVETRPGGYRLATDELGVDLDVLSELTAPGLEPDGDPSTVRRLTRALGLWRGRSLHDIADTDAGRGDAVRLDELRLSIAEARFECLLASGEAAAVVHDVEAFTVEHPYRERPHAVLMRALSGLGRHADALAAYQRLRTRLADDLGLEPSPGLRALEADVLSHRMAHVDPPGEVRGPPPAAPPARLTPLVGREDDVSALTAATGRSRLVTVVGAGGVGKTRLALELAHLRSGDRTSGERVLWCDLGPAGDEADVVELLARSVRARRQPDEGTRAAAIRAVAGAEPFLVLDNCEHVVEAVAELVADVLHRSERVRIVATSRTPLDIPGEDVIRLEPLRCEAGVDGAQREQGAADVAPPAVELFVERCAAAGVAVQAAGPDLDEAVRICCAVDGLPLGIELAAAQLRNMPLARLADRLDRELGPLEVGRRRGPSRHRSIGATLEWSYRLLSSDDQRLLAAISVFPGSFGADAAAAVLGDDDRLAVEDDLRALSDLSLLTVEPSQHALRFRLLGTTRSFGRGVLADQGSDVELLDRHARWVSAMLESQQQALRGAAEADAVRTIELETDDIRSVLSRATSHGDLDIALAVCCALADFAFYRLRDDLLDWTDRALALPGATEHRLAGRALAGLALGLTSRGDLTRADACARRAMEVGADDLPAQLAAHHALVLVALYSGRLDDAVDAATSQLALAEDVGDHVESQIASALCALARLYAGDHDAALVWAERSMVAAERSAQPSAEAWAEYSLGEVLAHRDPERAERGLERAIALGGAVDNPFVVGVAEVALATMRSAASDPRAALRTFGPIIRRWDERNDWTHQWTTLQNVAPLVARAGGASDAAVLVGTLTAATERPLFGGAHDGIRELEQDLARELGDELFQELRARGAGLSRREVVALALGLTEGVAP